MRLLSVAAGNDEIGLFILGESEKFMSGRLLRLEIDLCGYDDLVAQKIIGDVWLGGRRATAAASG